MSMQGMYQRLPPRLLDSIRRSSDEEIERFVVDTILEYEGPRTLSPLLDIDKAWHALHFLLCNHAWEGEPPLVNAVLGGQEIGPDLGYGPPRYLTAEEVKDVSFALAGLRTDELRVRFDPAALRAHEIYPDGWDADTPVDWLIEAFDSLKDYFAQAASAGDAMLLFLS
jgi:hypothetical protein